MEGGLVELGDLVFKNDIKQDKTIQITGSFDTTKDLFEALLMLFTIGMRILHGKADGTVELDNLSENEFSDFIKRFRSMGVTPVFLKYHTYQIQKYRNQFISDEVKNDWNEKDKASYENYETLNDTILNTYMETQSDNLSDYYFQFVSNCNYYVIRYVLL